MTPEEEDRRQVIAENLERVRGRVDRACAAAGRGPAEITIIAVTKTFPASDVFHLAALGVRDMGENRADEADDKEYECRTRGATDLTWHFVGQLQTNKAGLVAQRMDVVHSVDREKLVVALERAADRSGRRISCLVQVDLALDDPGRGGAAPTDVAAVAGAVAAAGTLDLAGLMAVAPVDGDPREAFARLAVLASELRTSYPEAVIVSAGMSGDLEVAIEHGATHLRVGTALLGSRPPLG